MKKIAIIVLLFVLQLYFAQQYTALVQYQEVFRAKGFKTDDNTTFLLINDEQSFHFNYLEPNADFSSVYSHFDKQKNNFRAERKANSNEFLLSTQYVNYAFYKDEIPEIKWQIKTDKKEILGFACQKAVGKFRGREYTVWFTTDIPYSYGPWKLGGLPGLILEAESDEKIVVYRATKIFLNKTYDLPLAMKEELKKQSKVISYKEYIKGYDEYLQKARAQIKASMPNGGDIQFDGDIREGLQEVVFEWEEKK